MKKAKKVINVFTGHTLEEYKSKYDIDKSIHIDRSTLNEFNKKHHRAKKDSPLDGRSWWLIDDTYYEIDPSLIKPHKVKSNHAAIKIALAGILGGVGVAGIGASSYVIIKKAMGNSPEPTSEISLSKSTDTIDLFRKDQLTVNNLPSGASVTWSSEDSNIATVDNEGYIKGVKTGSTNIVATVVSNTTKTLKCSVTIKMPEPTVHENIKYHYVAATSNEDAHYEVYYSNWSGFNIDYLALANKYSGKDDEGTEHGELPVTSIYYNSTSQKGGFANCEKLKTLIIPNGFTTIGEQAFSYCENLEDIYIPDSVVSFKKWSLSHTKIKNLTLSKNVKEFESVFYGGADIESVDLSQSNVSKLADMTFMDCEKLKTVKLNSNLNITTIPSMFFYGCTALENFELPKTITTIEGEAFKDCSSLHKIVLSDIFVNITSNPFVGCSSLTNFEVDSKNTVFKSSSDGKCLMKIVDNYLVSYPSVSDSLTIPSDIEVIGSSSFSFSKIKSVKFTKTQKLIEAGAFANCSNLEKVEFDSECTLNEIPDKAFNQCSNLKEVILHEGLTTIG